MEYLNFLTLIFSDVLNFRSRMNGFVPTLEGRMFDGFIARYRLNSVRLKRNNGAGNFP